MNPESYWARQSRRNISRRLLLTSGLAAGAVAVACGGRRSGGLGPSTVSGPGANEAPQSGGVYNFYHISNPPTLDLQRTTSYFTQEPVGAAHSRLFRFRTSDDPKTIESYNLENDLAVAAESPDATTWTVRLRPDPTSRSGMVAMRTDIQRARASTGYASCTVIESWSAGW